MARRITEDEVKKLYENYETPMHVIGHCRAVALVAYNLGEKLNCHGYNLDLDLIRGAGLAHDVARTSEEHGLVGAKILERMGFKDEADIVRVHMFYSPFNSIENLNETDLVCLGDRLVKEDHYVGLDERIQYILNKAPDKPEIRKSILERKEETRELLNQIEAVIGITIDELFSGEETND